MARNINPISSAQLFLGEASVVLRLAVYTGSAYKRVETDVKARPEGL